MIGRMKIDNNYRKRLFSQSCAFLLLARILFLGDLAFSGSMEGRISGQEVDLGDPIQLSLSITGDLEGDIKVPTVANVQISNAGKSTSVQYINGRMSSKVEYSFILTPKKAGSFEIPPFEAKIDGKIESTSPFTITVNKPKTLSKQELAAQKPAIYIEQKIEKPLAFVGEPVRVEVKIYQRINILGQEEVSTDTPGTINVPVNSADRAVRKEIGGTTYLVSTRYKYLVPVRPGKLELNPYELLVEIQDTRSRRSNDPFYQFFGGMSRQRKTIRSNTLQLEVQPTPQQNKPKNFSGLVGVFDGDAEIDRRTVMVGETVTATVQIAGSGRLEALGDIPLNTPPSMKVYPDKPNIKVDPTESLYKVSGIYKIALVPTQPGQISLSPVEIDYFDPEAKAYKTLKFELGSINVKENPEAQFTSRGSSPPGEEIQQRANYPKTESGSNENSETLVISSAYGNGFFKAANIVKILIGLAFLWVILIAFLFFEKRGMVFTVKKKRSNSRLKNELLNLLKTTDNSSQLNNADLRRIFELTKVFCAELADTREGSLTWREVAQILGETGNADAHQQKRLESFYETLEAIEFKSSVSDLDNASILENAANVRQLLEKT